VLLDSGSSFHLTGQPEMLEKHGGTPAIVVSTADDRRHTAQQQGVLHLPAVVDNHVGTFDLKPTYFVPGLTSTLVSVSQLVDDGYRVEFAKDGCTARFENDDRVALVGRREGGGFRVVLDEIGAANAATATIPLTKDKSLATWHRRLGHAGIEAIKRMAKSQVVRGLTIEGTGTDLPKC
jgi:hypothetical protein